jgi:hypothetical protein
MWPRLSKITVYQPSWHAVCRELGMNSLPVAFGVDGAKYICAATIDVTQLSVAAYLWAGLHEPIYAAVLLGLTLPQVGCTLDANIVRWSCHVVPRALDCKVIV